jgi:hypothetical protein
MWTLGSLDFFLDEGVTRTRTLGRETIAPPEPPEPFPPSKYSMSREVWE